VRELAERPEARGETILADRGRGRGASWEGVPTQSVGTSWKQSVQRPTVGISLREMDLTRNVRTTMAGETPAPRGRDAEGPGRAFPRRAWEQDVWQTGMPAPRRACPTRES
jgi:hypothetical protein